MARIARLRGGVGVVLLLGSACAVLLRCRGRARSSVALMEPGIHAGGPRLAACRRRCLLCNIHGCAPSWPTGRWAVPASAILLGALLAVQGVGAKWISSSSEALLPAGGGAFDGSTVHADARRAVPVNRWSHLALTYDGATLRLYVNGSQVSSRATTGTIKRTTDPLWIGGNHPYGEYFQGLIDQVRVYDRVLSPADVRAEMSTPSSAALTGRGPRCRVRSRQGLGDGGSRRARQRRRDYRSDLDDGGRFGGALRFHGNGEVVRVPAAASLNLMGPMTLSAWIRPSQPQSGWRTILSRQTDAYFLMAGGGTHPRLGGSTTCSPHCSSARRSGSA